MNFETTKLEKELGCCNQVEIFIFIFDEKLGENGFFSVQNVFSTKDSTLVQNKKLK